MLAVLATLFLSLVCTSATAAPAISCHCFRERAFDSAKPAAADPYILATTQNSLLSVVFGVEKKAVVRAKMTGTRGEDLWIAHLAADKAGLRAADLLDSRDRSGSWKEALAGLGVAPDRLGDGPAAVLSRNGPDEALASAVVDHVLTQRAGADPVEVKTLRSLGAANRGVIAAVLIARFSGDRPSPLYQRIDAAETSWGATLNKAGIRPQQMEDQIRKQINKPVK